MRAQKLYFYIQTDELLVTLLEKKGKISKKQRTENCLKCFKKGGKMRKKRLWAILTFSILAAWIFMVPQIRSSQIEEIQDSRSYSPDLESKYKSFRLETKAVIDTQEKNILEKGLYDIQDFCVDSEGNLYILNAHAKEDLIFKFDRKGNFIQSFGKKGEGPGQGEKAYHLHMTPNGRLFIQDSLRRKLVLFEKDGKLEKEIKVPSGIKNIYPLKSGSYIGVESEVRAGEEFFKNSLNHYTSNFKKEKQLDILSYPNPLQADKVKAYFRNLSFCVSSEKIYSAYPERGYEIHVFDLKGNLIKKIERQSRHIPVTNRYKEIFLNYLGPLKETLGDKLVYPKYLPPFHSFFTDETGYLFFMTYETGENKEEFIYDIMNPQGDLVARKSLGIFFDQSEIYVEIKGDFLYWVKEEETGYKKLIVSKIN